MIKPSLNTMLQQKLNKVFEGRKRRAKWLKKKRPFVITDQVPRDIKDFSQLMRAR